MNNITVIGAGYVGTTLAILLAQNNKVVLLDIDKDKVNQINERKPILADEDIDRFLMLESLKLQATCSSKDALQNKNFYIIATPTDFDESTNVFDASSVEETIAEIINNSDDGLIVIKSTVPVGFTDKMNKEYSTNRIIFSPEFLREGKGIYDNLNPSRVIIGGNNPEQSLFADLLASISDKEDLDIFYMSSSEAEAVKLFSNTYLAMRVSFFNELDSFALGEGLNTKKIIDGICADTRIGKFYNNPSFGYGGYCLPKDTKQLLATYLKTPQELIEATILANEVRKNFLVKKILEYDAKVIGIYRLAMKLDSDNFRESAVIDILNLLKKTGVKILIYEPLILDPLFDGSEVYCDLDQFKFDSEIILSNRYCDDLEDVKHKVFTRDIFGEN